MTYEYDSVTKQFNDDLLIELNKRASDNWEVITVTEVSSPYPVFVGGQLTSVKFDGSVTAWLRRTKK